MISGYQKALSSCPSGIMADDMASNLDSEVDDDEVEVDEDEEEDSSPISTLPSPNANGATRDLDLEVAAVLDVLPDLGIGFIRSLLTRYDDSEQAIAAILDDNLPPDLAQMDRQKEYIPPDPQDKQQRQTGIRHFNVHDGDRYDVLTRDQPECVIKQGKGLPGAPRNAEQLLDDKRDLAQLKLRYQQYALVEETPLESGEYDDEYDDSYEALNEGQAPPVSLLRAKLQAAASIPLMRHRTRRTTMTTTARAVAAAQIRSLRNATRRISVRIPRSYALVTSNASWPNTAREVVVEEEEEEEAVAVAVEVDNRLAPLWWAHPRAKDNRSRRSAIVDKRRPTNPRVPITIAKLERPSSVARE